MKVPKNLVFLGFVYELIWTEATLYQRERIALFPLVSELYLGKKGTLGLFSNGPGTAIFLLPLQKSSTRAGAIGRAQLKRLSQRWSGYVPGITIQIDVPDSATDLTEVGQLLNVEYTSDKLDRPGDLQGNFKLYTHRFKKPVDLFCDRKKQPRVWGAQARNKIRIVTSRGLVG